MHKNRRNEISLINVLMCFFVIYIHVASGVMGLMNVNSWQHFLVTSVWKLSSCAVPVFFFLSALKLSLGAEKQSAPYPKYIAARVRRVWLPYVGASVVYLTYLIGHHYMEFDLKNAVKLLLDGNVSAHFYFVIAVMQFYLLAPVWRGLARKLEDPVFAVIAVVSAYFIGLFFGKYLVDFIYIFYKGGVFPYSDRVFTTYIFWWVLGLAVGRNYERIRSVLVKHTVPVTVFFAFAAIHSVFLTYIHNTGKTYIYWLDTAHEFYVLSAILLLLVLGTRLADTKFANSAVIRCIDRSSYSIYLWHPLALYVSDIYVAENAPMSIEGILGMRLMFGFAVTLIICIGVSVVSKLISDAVRKRKAK